MLHLRGPAKINLTLQIRGQREDGFHDLASHFVGINLWDEMTIRPLQQRKCLTLSYALDHQEGVPIPAEDNLIFKAWRSLEVCLGYPLEFEVSLVKKIPIGGGLGGGSSNVALFLLGMQKLLGRDASQVDWDGLASSLGSDVPFFMGQHSAWVTGRGEHLDPWSANLEGTKIWLLCPKWVASTAQVFKHYAKSIKKKSKPFEKNSFSDPWYENCFNDLELVSLSLLPQLKSARAALLQFCEKVWMTGSGSCFVGVPKEGETLEEALAFCESVGTVVETEILESWSVLC